MEKDNNLADMNSIFNNQTLKYRINGFAKACNMTNLEILNDETSRQVLFNKKNSGANYYIVVNNGDSHSLGKGVTISGYYEDLNFIFTNFFDSKSDLDRKIRELPFSISLFKTIDNDTYRLEIETINGIETKFMIIKSREYKDKSISSKVSFYANVMDFSKVLKLVKSFVYNPILVFNTYDEIKEKKKVTFVGSELNKAIMQDENLDKPMGKIKKIVKRITNND